MPNKRADITVAVSRRILWIGAEAYPLHNIARAQTVRLEPNRAAAWRRAVIAIVVWLGAGVATAAALRFVAATASPTVRASISRA